MRFVRYAKNAVLLSSDDCFSARDECVESACSNFHPAHATHVVTSDFQAELISKLLLTCTHLRRASEMFMRGICSYKITFP